MIEKPKVSQTLLNNLCSAVSAGKLSHAVILEGADAALRMELANYLAAAIVCMGSEKPCGECNSCIKASRASHPDIIEVAGGETARSFPISKVREIRSMAYILPNEAQRKVFILRNAGSMGEKTQNALLKILEEPPEFVNFILDCNSKSVMLPTVLSRASVYSLGDESGVCASPEKLEKAKDTAAKIVNALSSGSEWDVMTETGVLEKDKELLRLCLPEVSTILGRALEAKYGKETEIFPAKISERVSVQRLMILIHAVNECTLLLSKNANTNLLITRLVSTTAAERNN